MKGRLLDTVGKGREAAALIEAGAIDGLSIGYRTKRASKTDKGQRLLQELELWEVSLVTFPMLPEARVGAKGESPRHDAARNGGGHRGCAPGPGARAEPGPIPNEREGRDETPEPRLGPDGSAAALPDARRRKRCGNPRVSGLVDDLSGFQGDIAKPTSKQEERLTMLDRKTHCL